MIKTGDAGIIRVCYYAANADDKERGNIGRHFPATVVKRTPNVENS